MGFESQKGKIFLFPRTVQTDTEAQPASLIGFGVLYEG
jgi:hypothetical protein